MNIIAEITDEMFGIEKIPFNNPKIRYGARGIIINKDNKNGKEVRVRIHQRQTFGDLRQMVSQASGYALDKMVMIIDAKEVNAEDDEKTLFSQNILDEKISPVLLPKA